MKNEIRIAKKLCEKVDTPYQYGYYINMLPTSKFAGYRFFVSDYFFIMRATYGEIEKSKNAEYRFTLEKIDREPGKRYARPKLYFEELQAEFSEHSAQFYSDTLPQALVYVKRYANNGTRNAGRVMDCHFCIGGIDKMWFYESDTKRRRLNTNGVQIIKVLESDEAKQMKEKIKRLEILRDSIHDFTDCQIDYKNKYFYTAMLKVLTPTTVSTITQKLNEINEIIATEATDCRQEAEDLQKYFDGLLKENGLPVST